MPTYSTLEAAPIADTGVSADSTLPGLRGLAKLSDLRPVIKIDSREIQPLQFERLASVVGTLYSGDYALAGGEWIAAVERKSIDDAVASIQGDNRERFERELMRLRGCRFRRLVIVGSLEEIAAGRYHSKMNPRAVLASLFCFEIRYEVPLVFCPTPEAAARQIENWMFWNAREVVENANDLLRGSKATTLKV
jgi:DNA excision repair protein ERCC-4